MKAQIEAWEVSLNGEEIAEDYYGCTQFEAVKEFCEAYGYMRNEVTVKEI